MRNSGRRSRRARGRRDRWHGAPLWLYLTALVLVPLTGVVVLSTSIARTRTAEAAGAARAEDAVRVLARLDAARGAVDRALRQTKDG